MRWKGETTQQWLDRTAEWHKHFLWVPRQMKDGSWIWLETIWRKRDSYVGGWTYSDALIKPETPMQSSLYDPKE